MVEEVPHVATTRTVRSSVLNDLRVDTAINTQEACRRNCLYHVRLPRRRRGGHRLGIRRSQLPLSLCAFLLHLVHCKGWKTQEEEVVTMSIALDGEDDDDDDDDDEEEMK